MGSMLVFHAREFRITDTRSGFQPRLVISLDSLDKRKAHVEALPNSVDLELSNNPAV